MGSIVRKGLVGLLIALFAAGGLLAGLALYAAQALQPTPAEEQGRKVSYPAGTSAGALAAQLESQGLIRSASLFVWYLKWKNEGAKFQAGEYEFTPGMTLKEMIERLNRGQTVKAATLRLTVPEGYTIQQIAERLKGEGIDPQQFLRAASLYKGDNGSAAGQIPEVAGLRERLEGYLFPETYEWNKDATAEDIVATMARQLDEKLEQLPGDWRSALARRGQSLHQLLTVASLIEREVAAAEERRLVSGVIYNRLQKGMPLQIDATVQYLFDKQKERLFEKDLQIESPYNTYLHTGLPPGPIASPSLASIEAALNPEETKYLFYVTKKDGSKGHLFAETYEQHQKNIAESKK